MKTEYAAINSRQYRYFLADGNIKKKKVDDMGGVKIEAYPSKITGKMALRVWLNEYSEKISFSKLRAISKAEWEKLKI